MDRNFLKTEELSLNKIKINDNFWNKYTQLVRKEIIPYQWAILNDQVPDAEPSSCIRNFKIAAGEMEGEFHGAVFQDTDVAKWLEAVAYSLAIYPDEELEQLADETIALIEKAQQSDGYLNTYYTVKEPEGRFKNLVEGHELYTAGHMTEAAVAYYEATGKKQFLEVMMRFADLLCDTFGPEADKCNGYPGHQEIELALVKLYRATGVRKYLELAKYFIEARGVGDNYFLKEINQDGFQHIFPEFSGYDTKYSQSHLPVREQETAEGHSVRAVYMYCAMADLAYEYQDETMMEACERLWNNIVSKRMYITGGIGSSGILERFTTDYDLPNDENYSETCASIGLALFGKRMAQITRDASYIDVVEKALYNTLLSGIAMDGKSFFYVNPLEVWPDNCMPRTSKDHVKAVRQKWFSVACCPPNIARTLASLGQYIYFQDKDEFFINLFVAGETETKIDNNNIKIIQETDFPFTDMVKVKVEAETETYMKLYIRIPEYVQGYDIKVNGKKLEKRNIEKGYLLLEQQYKQDEIEISWDIPPVYMRANPNVRADEGKTAIQKGPLVYCLEEADNGKNLAGIYADTSQELEVEYRDDLFGGVPVIIGKGKKIVTEAWTSGQLYKAERPKFEDITYKAVPYCYWCNRTPGEMLVWMREIL